MQQSFDTADTLPDAQTHSEGFRISRVARQHAIIEDYVELIADLLDEGQEARQVDLATRLGVSQPTVAKMLVRLSDEGLVARKPYRGIFLTPDGREMAEKVRVRHRIVEAFLLALGVSPCNARIDAEGLEHYVGAETLEAFQLAMDAGLDTFMQKARKK
ncbi:transcriptional regulator MntR [Acetobacter pasteurianus]|uniref:Transcriptional regulator MntR n=1 Tax=Acetobacter pasteurianus TaxID=438 RepID=A0A1A0DIQ5_ACEPA|nr:manganese-binding transcriptional regulator MntR [Acetobacter pasteurianus]OAZ74562.1 Transcriptional regulator MntR [Acetobacter pasteurianus]RCL06302.1 transcriptional regulator MntR [Acetobacter pasteurianus]GCD49730.1 manganese transport regulator MntR [Acetobacter pasteurianus subsp. pasteurianus LMG 1262 = NBRC 106471]CCT58351.1 manganese transport regulator MntR [Acetobacter pasteurianus 386B]